METKQKPRLHYGRLKEVASVRRELYADIPSGITLEEIVVPDYWMHFSRDLRPMDLIEAFCEDGSWEATLRVMFVSPTDIRVKVRSSTVYDTEEVSGETETHIIKWRGPARLWAVVHKESNNVVKDGLTKDKAHEYLRDYLKQIGT